MLLLLFFLPCLFQARRLKGFLGARPRWGLAAAAAAAAATIP
jgi:hypothetical protein